MCSARLKDDVRVNPHLAPPLDGCNNDNNGGLFIDEEISVIGTFRRISKLMF